MIEFNDGAYGLIVEFAPQPSFHKKQDETIRHYGRPWRVRLPTGEDRWHSANSFKRKV